MLIKPPAIVDGPNGLLDTSKLSHDLAHRVFENIGGVEKLTEVALEDPKWFYGKIWVKTIQPQKVEVQRDKTVAELLDELDSKMVRVLPKVEVIEDVDFEGE